MSLSTLPVHQIELFVPEYRTIRSGAWELRQTENILCQGFWSPAAVVPCVTALMRDGDVWMSITPLELESQSIGIMQARGHVAIFGLGMGWAAAATALNDAVSMVTVVEADTDVIALHQEIDIFSQLPPEARKKIRIERDDAFTWIPSVPVDLLMPDIWLPLVSDRRVEEVRHMQHNVGASAIYFWGQELEIARHAVKAGRAIDDAGIAATVAGFDLPLIGPETAEYASRVALAAKRWMGNRWL